MKYKWRFRPSTIGLRNDAFIGAAECPVMLEMCVQEARGAAQATSSGKQPCSFRCPAGRPALPFRQCYPVAK